jgi:hypothetical protein
VVVGSEGLVEGLSLLRLDWEAWPDGERVSFSVVPPPWLASGLPLLAWVSFTFSGAAAPVADSSAVKPPSKML